MAQAIRHGPQADAYQEVRKNPPAFAKFRTQQRAIALARCQAQPEVMAREFLSRVLRITEANEKRAKRLKAHPKFDRAIVAIAEARKEPA